MLEHDNFLNTNQIESAKAVIGDLIGNIAFISYVILGAKFVISRPDGSVFYDRERHIKCYEQIESDFDAATNPENEQSENDSYSRPEILNSEDESENPDFE